MYKASQIVEQMSRETESSWQRYSPQNYSEIEFLVKKREKDAKLAALAELFYLLDRREKTPVLTKENTEVKWIKATRDMPAHAEVTSDKLSFAFDRIGYSYARIWYDDDNRFSEISLIMENEFAWHDSCGVSPAFFIEKKFLLELSEQADKFVECEECGYTLNECECCCECGKYECECHFCEYCEERNCYGECVEDDEEDF